MDKIVEKTEPVTIAWGGGEDAFWLAIKDMMVLEQELDMGLMQMLRALETDGWRAQLVREIVRVGLIGGGMAPAVALQKVKDWVDDRPLAPNVLLAHAIVGRAIFGRDYAPIMGAPPAASAEA